MNNQDYAIVVGINYYPKLGSLEGAEYDADQFAAWLADPNGGALPDQNIRRVRTCDFHPPPPATDFDAKPNVDSFQQQLLALVTNNAGNGLRQPAGRRLYLYFSGHGFSGSSASEAALYAANAGYPQYPHIAATRYADWLQSAALYQEIILIMDCCRDMTLISPILSIALHPYQNAAAAALVRQLNWYAVPVGMQARERQIDPNGPVRGVFTYLLLEALHKAPPDASGNVWADRVADYIQTRWTKLAPSEPPPVLPVDQQRNIALARRTATPLCVVNIQTQPAVADGTTLVVEKYEAGQLKEVLRTTVQAGVATCSLEPNIYKFSLEGSTRAELIEVIGSEVHAEL